MPNLAQMETLVLIADTGSLAAAGRQLGISAAAVSKQLTRLEEELGLQLLVRTTRRVELTEVGVNYCNQCRRVVEEVESASALVSQVKAVPHGVLKIVSGRYFATTYIVPHMKEFLNQYPEIEIDLELAERIPDLNLEGVDVMIGMSVSATGDAIQKRIATTRYVLCASPKYLKEFGTPKKPDDLKKLRYIAHSMRKPDSEWQFGDKDNIVLKPYIRVNDAQTMLDFTLEGLGIAKLHHYLVKEYLENGMLIEILHEKNRVQIPIFAAYPQRRFISSKVRCFLDFIVGKIENSYHTAR